MSPVELGGYVEQLARLKHLGASFVKISADGDLMVAFAPKVELPSESYGTPNDDEMYRSGDV